MVEIILLRFDSFVKVRAWSGSSGSSFRFASSSGARVFVCFSTVQGDGTVPVPVSVPEKRFWWFRFRFRFLGKKNLKKKKDPHPQDFSLTKKTARFTKANVVLAKDRKRPYCGHFCGKLHRRCLVVKRPGVLSKVQILTLVLGVGVFSVLLKSVPTVPVSNSSSLSSVPEPSSKID